MRHLVAGPFIGEFGWEIIRWIPYLRKICKKFDKITVVTRKDHHLLYEFASDHIEYNHTGRSDMWKCLGEQPRLTPNMLREGYTDTIIPSEQNCMKGYNREYRKYGIFDEKLKYDLVIHPRARKDIGKERNWKKQNYLELISMLKKYNPSLKICYIGTLIQHLESAENRSCIDIITLCNLLRSSRLLIGPSSGPMHLGALCGINHIVWTDKAYQKAIKTTNRERYEHLWNPFLTPVTVVDDMKWNPSVNRIYQEIVKYI